MATAYRATVNDDQHGCEIYRHSTRWAIFQHEQCDECASDEGLSLVLGFDDIPSHLRCECGAIYTLKEFTP